MVFENLTLVELNLENARIGPRFGGDDEEDVEMAAPEEAASGGSKLGAFGGLLFLVGVGAALAYWRSRSDESVAGDDGEQITIESAAEQ